MQAMYNEQPTPIQFLLIGRRHNRHTHTNRKWVPAGLYSDLQPGRIGELEGQSSAGTWPCSHGLPTCPCGVWDSCGRAWEDRTLQPPWWDSNPHGQTKGMLCTGCSKKTWTTLVVNTFSTTNDTMIPFILYDTETRNVFFIFRSGDLMYDQN